MQGSTIPNLPFSTIQNLLLLQKKKNKILKKIFKNIIQKILNGTTVSSTGNKSAY